MVGRTDQPGDSGRPTSAAPPPKPGEGVLAAEAISDACLRLAQEAAGLGIYDCDTVLNVYHWDERMRAFWGFSATDSIGYDAVMEAIHPDDRDAMLATWDRALDPNGTGRFVSEYRVFDRRDGTLRWIAAIGKAIFVDGCAVRLLGTAQDITERKRVEEILGRNADADAFRLAFADGLRPLTDPVSIQAAAARILGEHLRASRVHYAEADESGADTRVYADYCFAVPSVVGRYHLDDYGPTVMAELRAGRTLVIENVGEEPRLSPGERAATAALQIGAYVMVPLLRDGVARAFLVVHQSRPRVWRADEIQLIEETAERTWAAVERARAEADFRRSEHNLSAIIEALPVGIAVANEAGLMLSANPTALHIHGFESLADLVVRFEDYDSAFDISYPDGRPMPLDEWPWARANRREFVKDFEAHLCRRDGEERIVSYSLMPVLGDSPGDRLIVFVMQDITESRRIRESLERNLAQSQAVFENMSEGLLIFDRNGVLLDANPAALAIHGVSSIDELPQSVDTVLSSFELLDPEGNPLAQEDWPISRALRGEVFSNYEIRVRSRHSDHQWIGSYGGTPVYDGAGEMRLAIFTVRDVTAQHEAEAALREADRRKDVFLATLAHELRTPLAAIGAAIGVVRGSSDDTRLLPQLDLVDRQLAQLVHLVDDLLDVGRITRGAIDLRRERVPFADVLAQAIDSVRPALERAGHDFAVEPGDTELVLDGDRLRLAQVFQNLLTNAAKYTPPGGRVRIRAQRSGNEVAVSVTDDGIGIAPEHLSQLFGMFARPAHTKHAHDGLGIGLALARSLVEMHGGSITARSDGPGRGSEFVVRLPLAPEVADSAAAQPARESRAATVPLRSRTPRRVLIADDNPDVGTALATFLRVAGNEVELARDGVEAVEIAARFRPEVVFLDIDMPRLDGNEACRRIRAQPWGSDMVILAFTGWGAAESHARAAEAGFDRHLVKPILPEALLALLDDADSVRRT